MPVGITPEIGEHTGEILSGILDMPEDEISALREQGVV
jgi:crotonobetainyl-CoA:carnitine CoA-transferase CaiB-like acyl-CoA transferase